MPNQAKQNQTKPDRPPWYAAVVAELGKLTGHWKQEPTLLGILSAEVNGEGWDRPYFWSQPQIANRNTYYKWIKQDSRFVEVLENCRQAIKLYRREAAINMIDEAMLIIQEGSPQAAKQLVQEISLAEYASDRIRASNSVLDRASKSTASKQADQTIHMPEIADAMAFVYGEEEDEPSA
jgi:hypothetical protein